MGLPRIKINPVTPFHSNLFSIQSDLDPMILENIRGYKIGNKEIILSVHLLEENIEKIFSEITVSDLNISFMNKEGKVKYNLSFDGIFFKSISLETSYEESDLLVVDIIFAYEKFNGFGTGPLNNN